MTRGQAATIGLTGLALSLAVLLMVQGGRLALSGTDAVILWHIRLPRVLLAATVGAMLGLAGTLLQTVLRNPLATPDVIGFGGGAAAGAALSIAVTGGLSMVLPAAMAGCLLSAALIVGLAWRNGARPLALIVIGVAVNLTLAAMTDVTLSLAPGLQAAEAARFLTGSLSAAHWLAVALALAALAVAGVAAAALSHGLRHMDMGDDMARAHGLRPTALRVWAAVVSALLTGLAVALTGPLPFIALLAGPLARAVSRDSGPLPVRAALTGACLALAADLAARQSLMGQSLPAGLYTALVGGPAMFAMILAAKDRS